jgi:hypothetical protein
MFLFFGEIGKNKNNSQIQKRSFRVLKATRILHSSWMHLLYYKQAEYQKGIVHWGVSEIWRKAVRQISVRPLAVLDCG